MVIGHDVPVQIWRDISVTPWAVLLCIHGLSLHAKSFEAFGKAMSHVGVPSYAMDVRGFGSWQNAQGASHLDFEKAFADIKNTLEAVRRSNPGLPVVLVGESMGGAIALQATAANPELIDGLICSVPSRKNSGQSSTGMKAAIGLIYHPNGEIDVGDKVIRKATQEIQVAEDWEHDPLSRMDYSPKELLQFRNLMNNNQIKAAQITNTPVLFLQGGSDKLVKPAGTIGLLKYIKAKDKDLVVVGTAQHLILEQGQFDDTHVIKDDVITIVSSWIDKHVANPETEPSEDATNLMSKYSDATRQARGHFKMAEGSLLLNDAETAKDHLATVLRLAHGTMLAQKADQLMLTLPEHLIAPPVGTGPHDDAELVSINAAKSNDKPTILIFCAPWIDSCKTLLEDLNRVLGVDQNKVNIVWINADREDTQSLVKEYGIGPLPAVLYMTYNNEVLLYSLGNPGDAVTRSRIRKLLAADAELHAKDREKKVASP